MKRTPTAEDVKVTNPPPNVLKTTAPSVVSTAVAEAGAAGATVTVVAAGTVEAKMAEERMEETLAALELDAASALLWAGVEAVDEVVVVELLSCLFFARCTSLLAMTGFSEWTCSIAARSLLNTPSWNLGDSECKTECRAAGSTVSSRTWKASQLTNDLSSSSVCLGEPKEPKSKLLKTSALQKPTMMDETIEYQQNGPSEWWIAAG